MDTRQKKTIANPDDQTTTSSNDDTGRITAAGYEAILQNMSDGFVIADASGKITDMNPVALSMFGFASNEDMARVMSGDEKVMDVTTPDGKELSVGQLPMARVCAGERFTGQEYSVYIRHTKRRWYASFSGAPVFDASNTIEFAVLTIRDITEKKQAEWAAQAASDLIEHKMNEAIEMQNRLDAVMQALPVGVALLDAQGGQVSANKRFDEIWGHPILAAKTIGDYIQDKASWVDSGKTVLPDEWASSRALHNGETVIGQIIRIQGFDGVQRVVLNSAAPILDAHGEVAGCAVAIQDITRQMEFEKAVRESERKYEELVRIAPAGIYEVDFRTKKFTSVNDAMCLATGYSREELLSMGPFEILDDEGRAAFQTRVNTWLRGEKPDENVEYRIKTKNGREMVAVLNVKFTVDENGRPVGATVVAHDITERKRAEQALRESEARLRAIFEASADAIGVSKAGIHFAANPAYLALFGYYANDDLIGKPITDLIAPSYRPIVAGNARRRVQGESVPSSYETRGLRKDDTEFDMDARVSTYIVGGEVFSVVILRDITDRKKTEEELSRRMEELRANNEELVRFNRAAVDRELRMVELKKQVNELCVKMGMEPRYKTNLEEKKIP